jgi:hypothetical protein
MLAKFAGKCACGRRFVAGASIRWNPITKRVLRCDGCRPVPKFTGTKPWEVTHGPKGQA